MAKILFIICLLLTSTSTADTDYTLESLFKNDFDYFTIEDGLPENAVRCMEKDQYGNYWICTNAGLVRYDGYEFEVITQDHLGNEITDLSVRDIKIVENIIYIGTRGGLYSLNLSTGLISNIDLFGSDSRYVLELKTHNGFIYVGTTTGLYSYKSGITKLVIANHSIRSFFIDDRQLIIGSIGKGLIKYTRVDESYVHKEIILSFGNTVIIEIKLINDEFYISTHGDGLYIYDYDFNNLNHLKKCDSENCINSDFIASVSQFDQSLVVSTRQGWLTMSEDHLVLSYDHPVNYINHEYISNELHFVREFDNHVWLGLHPGGLIRLKKNINGVKVSSVLSSNGNGPKSGIYSVVEHESDVYVGTYSGLYKQSTRDTKFKLQKAVSSNIRINAMCVLNRDFILISSSSGVYKYDPARKTSEILQGIDVNDISLSNLCTDDYAYFSIVDRVGLVLGDSVNIFILDEFNAVNTILKIHKDGKYLYIGSSNDLYRYKILPNLNLAFDKKYDINMRISDIVAHDEQIYVLAGNEILQVDKIKSFSIPLELPRFLSAIVPYGLELIDEQLWVSSNNGLIKITGNKEYHQYLQSHGLGDKEFNFGGLLYQKSSNTLYAGGQTSLTSIDLKLFQELPKHQNILSKLTITTELGQILSQRFDQPEQIQMHEGHALYLDLGHLDSPTRTDSNFYYEINYALNDILIPLDTNERRITLVNVGADDFMLELPFSNYSVNVDVIPYFWKRWWAIAIYFTLAFLVGIYIFRHYRAIQESKLNEAIIKNQLDSKRQQLASLSHELRTPLNSIIGILNESDLSGRNREYLLSSSTLLRSLIDNVLNNASDEVGNDLTIINTPVSICDLVEHCLRILEPYLDSSGIKVRVNIDASLPDKIMTDGVKIQQVLINLLKNAIKHGESTTEIAIALVADQSVVKISVTDNGVGVPKEFHDKIFEVFHKDLRHSSGFGLGLHISKVICIAMGGELDIDRNFDQGARFLVSFKYDRIDEDLMIDTTDEKKIREQCKSVLILEDDPLNAHAIKLLLDKLEHSDYYICKSLAEFYSQYSKSVDVLLLDLNFGAEVNGLQLAKKLRQQDFKGDIYIHSAENSEEIVEQSQSYVTEYIIKPAGLSVLERVTFNWS